MNERLREADCACSTVGRMNETLQGAMAEGPQPINVPRQELEQRPEPADICCDDEVECEVECCVKQNHYEFREFSVKKLEYGYIITIGCHKMAIETKERLAKCLSDYVKDPDATERKWWTNKEI